MGAGGGGGNDTNVLPGTQTLWVSLDSAADLGEALGPLLVPIQDGNRGAAGPEPKARTRHIRR